MKNLAKTILIVTLDVWTEKATILNEVYRVNKMRELEDEIKRDYGWKATFNVSNVTAH